MGGIRGAYSVKKPLLSVIMPVYNGEKYLREAVDGILNSSYGQIELLLIDDGSADGSGAICAEYVRRDSRVRYIRKENGGIVSARNRGLEEAGGEYVCFCDQDDFVEPMMYERLLERMEAFDAQVGMCGTGRLINGKKSPYERLEDGEYEGQEIRRRLLYPLLFRGYDYAFAKSGSYLYGTVWKCIFNRSFLVKKGISFKRFIDYEDDWIFVTETLCAAKRAVADSYTGYYWRVSGASKSHSCQFVEDMTGRMRKYDAYVSHYLERGIVDTEILEAYSRVSLCEHFVMLYRNETGIARRDKEKRRTYRQEVRAYMESADYKACVRCAEHLKKGVLRRRAVLVSIRLLGIERTFFISRAVDLIEKTLGSVQWIVRLERRMKG
ncbi:MAG: glycosyltransferase [Lachnospiraceae bacterium]|nr:glycosyltransferase [Lachnospiraceae bacterium]